MSCELFASKNIKNKKYAFTKYIYIIYFHAFFMLHVIQFVCCYIFFYHFCSVLLMSKYIFSLYKNYYYLFIYPISLLLILLLFSYDIFLFNFLLFVFFNMLNMRHFQWNVTVYAMNRTLSLYLCMFFTWYYFIATSKHAFTYTYLLLLIVYVFFGRMYILLFMNSIKIQSIANKTTKTTTKT